MELTCNHDLEILKTKMLSCQCMYTFTERMANWRNEIDSELSSFFTKKIGEKTDDFIRKVVELLGEFTLGGGKRVRPVLVIAGHDLFSPHDEKIVKASISMEISQSYFLIQDDVMDQSDLRRGKPSFHVAVTERLLSGMSHDKRLAENIAIVASDLAESYCHETLLSSGFPPDRLRAANYELSKVFEMTGEGQLLDLYSSINSEFAESDLMRTHLLKTANYTVSGPLKIGTILSGNISHINDLNYFGSLIGVAFQIQDDILGLYGSEKTIGKSPKTDMNEGKKTLLILKAMERSSDADRKFIASRLGKGSISDEDFERVKKIVSDTGSLDFSIKISRDLVERGKKYLDNVDGNVEIKSFLGDMADYLIKREN